MGQGFSTFVNTIIPFDRIAGTSIGGVHKALQDVLDKSKQRDAHDDLLNRNKLDRALSTQVKIDSAFKSLF